MELKYTEESRVRCYMTDYQYILRPDAFLDLAQDMAGKGAQLTDFNDDNMRANNCAWVLARMQVKFIKPVRYDEKIKMQTWHKGLNGLYFLRDYQLLDERGEVAVNSSSSWIVMNTETRRISRDEAVMKLIDIAPQSSDQAIEEPCPKVAVPRGIELEEIGSHKVMFSDVDYNGHANNVQYTVWALDHLPEELVFKHKVKEIVINFNKEARAGETVTLYHAEVDGAHIVEGKSDGHQVFIEKFIFD